MALPSSTFKFSSLHPIRIKFKSPTTKTHFPTTAINYKHQESSVYYCIRNLRRLAPKNTVNYVKGMVPNAGAGKGTKDSNFGRIKFLSNFVGQWKNIDFVFLGRKWSAWDVIIIMLVVSLHFLCLFAPFTFSWGAFWLAFSLYIITGMLGITTCYHRLLTHRSFKLPKWLEYFFAYCGVLAIQRDPIFWVRTHRCHHQYVDLENDPHSPTKGFWFCHLTWLFDNNSINEKCMNCSGVQDLEEQPFYKFLESTYIIHILGFAAILYAIGGFPYLVWGCAVRAVSLVHATWMINSVCHIWGTQTWNTGDLSRNNWFVAVFLSFGEGWHNNHHAFEYSARHGLEWWQIDFTWYLIKFFEIIGLATDVKLPTPAHKQRMALKN